MLYEKSFSIPRISLAPDSLPCFYDSSRLFRRGRGLHGGRAGCNSDSIWTYPYANAYSYANIQPNSESISLAISNSIVYTVYNPYAQPDAYTEPVTFANLFTFPIS